MLTESVSVYCPYCGEKIEVVVDGSVEAQTYIEDCSVCCRPMELSVSVIGDVVSVDLHRDDD